MNQISPEKSQESATPTGTKIGYRTKPAWIYLVAAILMLAPLGNFIWALITYGVPEWYKPSLWLNWAQFIDLPTWILLALLFSAGLSLLFVRRWSWTYSVAVIVVITVYDIAMFRHFLNMGPLAAVSMITLTVSFALILYFSEFRQPYLNPRLRWWETSPRYKVDLPATLSNFNTPGTIVDISRSGVLIEWPTDVTVPNLEGACQISLPENIKLSGIIRRQTARGFGIQFDQVRGEDKQALLGLIETLKSDPTKLAR